MSEANELQVANKRLLFVLSNLAIFIVRPLQVICRLTCSMSWILRALPQWWERCWRPPLLALL
jgi:hypothetical protein